MKLLARYSGRHESYISCRKQSSCSTALSKLAYHTTKQQALKPITDFDENSSGKEEPIADDGIPTTLTTVPIVKRLHHTEVKFPKLQILGPFLDANSLPLFNEKCDACCIFCDFSDPESDVYAKNQKTISLKEINDAISHSSENNLDEESTQKLLNMIVTNLTRPIPPLDKKYLVYDEQNFTSTSELYAYLCISIFNLELSM